MPNTIDERGAMIQRFCERWLVKAGQYNGSRLEDAFDRFFTLFVAFNRLYFHTAEEARKPGAGDRQSATELFPNVVGDELLWEALVQEGGLADVQTLANLIGPNGSFFVISSRGDRDKPDRSKNRDLHQRLRSESPRVVVRGVLEYLYHVRCNMFHGQKAFEDRQLELLQPCSRCLERIVMAGLNRISSRILQPRPPARLAGHNSSRRTPALRSSTVAR